MSKKALATPARAMDDWSIAPPMQSKCGSATSRQLTTSTATREAMKSEEALEVLTQKVAHRFRPELVPLFKGFLQRLSNRPLGR